MRSLMIFVFALFLMVLTASGCGKQADRFGNFANVQSVGLVEDSVAVLKLAHPPAKTRLNLMQFVNDAFGAALVETLRRDGYAIAEYSQPAREDKLQPMLARANGLDFAYIIDHLPDDSGMRVTLFVGEESLSRAYAVGGSPEEPTYSPLGDWARRKSHG